MFSEKISFVCRILELEPKQRGSLKDERIIAGIVILTMMNKIFV
jgi:hypothetical protein